MTEEAVRHDGPLTPAVWWHASGPSSQLRRGVTSVVWVHVHVDTTGHAIEVPTLLTSKGLLRPLLEYSIKHALDRSIAWHLRLMRSVALFVAYVHANPGETGTYKLFRNFALRLHTGTFDEKSGADSSGLCWFRRSYVEATRLQGMLRDFFIYLDDLRAEGQAILPTLSVSQADMSLMEAAYQHARDQSMLGHTWRPKYFEDGSARQPAYFQGRRPPKALTGNPPSFDDDEFPRFLRRGFKVGKRHDLRGMLITLLMHFAGFRESEPFHLYTHDVLPDPDDPELALVLIHHPSLGAAPSDWRDLAGHRLRGDRRTYLQQKWNLKPRNELHDRRHAGWKGGLLEERWGSTFMRAYWFPESAGRTFYAIWKAYMAQLACTTRDHPFAFVNLVRGHPGDMYCLPAFDTAHMRAVARVGLEHAKHLGTSRHGHRHAYGRRLAAADIPKHIRRVCMHHVSESSQDVYTQPTHDEVRGALMKGLRKASNTRENNELEELLLEIRAAA